MKTYMKMIVFVLIMGILTSVLLGGMDALTKERIEKNQEAELKSVVLNANNVSYSLTNIHNVFDEEINIIKKDDFIFYEGKDTKYISYVFSGNGVWGPITGVITLKSDFQTIVKISILEQEETPGLGGVIADAKYLLNYVGKKMLPEINITKNPVNEENDVIAISGATRTSNAFKTILNQTYQIAKEKWESRG